MRYNKSAERAAAAKRQTALHRPEIGGGPSYINADERLPDDPARECTAWAADDDGSHYRLPFPVTCRDGKWFNVRGNPLAVRIVGWVNGFTPTTKRGTTT